MCLVDPDDWKKYISCMALHDNSYKNFFSHSRMVEDLLKGFVREEWVRKLDFSTLERVNSSYVSEDLRDRTDDIVWKVRWGKDWLYVYILLEFQSTVDPWMAVRIMTYLGLLYQDLIKEKQFTAGKMLPPVLPIVLYNGDSEWKAATNINELIYSIPGGLAQYHPSLQYLLLSEREYADKDLKELNNLVAALFRLENSKNAQQLHDVVIQLLQWLSSPQQDSLRRAFTVWFSRVLFPARLSDEDQPAIEELDEVKNMLANRVKEWEQDSWNRGVEKGLQKGLQKGRVEVLLNLLEIKFGELPENLRSICKQASEEQLQQWTRQILTAENLGDIFGN